MWRNLGVHAEPLSQARARRRERDDVVVRQLAPVADDAVDLGARRGEVVRRTPARVEELVASRP